MRIKRGGGKMTNHYRLLESIQNDLEDMYDRARRGGIRDTGLLKALTVAEDLACDLRIQLCNDRVKSEKPVSLFESQAFSLRGIR
jgi:hypothetical protein